MATFEKYTGGSVPFDFKELSIIDEQHLISYCSRLRSRFKKQKLLPNALEEWIFRTYAAVKLILSATVMLSSAEYAETQALKIVEPYLLYYSLFNTSRAFVLLIPDQEWSGGRLLNETTHRQIRNVTENQLRQLSSERTDVYRDLAERALIARELFSYKFPAEGLKGRISDSYPNQQEIIKTCRLIAELAELNSECLEAEFKELDRPMKGFSEETLIPLFEYEHKLLKGALHDSEDYYRLGRILGKAGRPVSLWLTATEGLVEDFFGAWNFAEDETQYRPDASQWDVIFPFH